MFVVADGPHRLELPRRDVGAGDFEGVALAPTKCDEQPDDKSHAVHGISTRSLIHPVRHDPIRMLTRPLPLIVQDSVFAPVLPRLRM